MPEDFCTQNPRMATPCYVNGNPTGGGNSGGYNSLIGFPYSATGSGQVASSTIDTIGAVADC